MKFLQLFLLLSLVFPAIAQKTIKLSSPDGNIQYTFRLKKKIPVYNVSFKNKPLIADAELSLSFLENGTFRNNLKLTKPLYREADENYELIVGKAKMVHDHYKEVIISIEENTQPFRKINLKVRAFNDGLAFRYEFPEQKDRTSFSLTEENTSFKFVGDPKLLALFLPNFTTSHEGEYSSLLVSEVKEDTLIDMPALFEFPNQVYVAVT